ncbi:hypothetical protein DFS34DRAFT_645173 [Phlyctochytrium arcticum]|nr:hypothetical protein DFS34DRAFT_645173 [Phlyctochytrium arcticum]
MYHDHPGAGTDSKRIGRGYVAYIGRYLKDAAKSWYTSLDDRIRPTTRAGFESQLKRQFQERNPSEGILPEPTQSARFFCAGVTGVSGGRGILSTASQRIKELGLDMSHLPTDYNEEESDSEEINDDEEDYSD